MKFEFSYTRLKENCKAELLIKILEFVENMLKIIPCTKKITSRKLSLLIELLIVYIMINNG